MQQKAIYPEAWFTSLETILHHPRRAPPHHLLHTRISRPSSAPTSPKTATTAPTNSSKPSTRPPPHRPKAQALSSLSLTPPLIPCKSSTTSVPTPPTTPRNPLPGSPSTHARPSSSAKPNSRKLVKTMAAIKAHPRYKEELIELYLAQDQLAKAQATLNSIPRRGQQARQQRRDGPHHPRRPHQPPGPSARPMAR